mgnify:CR=1 FL=1
MKETIIGIEIGGTKLQIAIGTSEGELLDTIRCSVNADEGGKGIRKWLETNLNLLIKKAENEYGPVRSIGCGFGGPINSRTGVVLSSVQVKGWQNFPLQEWLQATFSKPASVDNDSNAAAYGEFCKGSGQGCEHFFYTNIGSGVGGGFIFNGKLFDGQGFGAGEFGHTFVPDLLSKESGKLLEIEHFCSGWSIESRLNRTGYVPINSELSNLSKRTTKDLANAALSGDSFAIGEIDKVAHVFGIGLANVLNLTNIERIAIGGGVANIGSILLDPIRKYTDQYVFLNSKGRYTIHPSQLGDSVVLVGAILRASGINSSNP